MSSPASRKVRTSTKKFTATMTSRSKNAAPHRKATPAARPFDAPGVDSRRPASSEAGLAAVRGSDAGPSRDAPGAGGGRLTPRGTRDLDSRADASAESEGNSGSDEGDARGSPSPRCGDRAERRRPADGPRPAPDCLSGEMSPRDGWRDGVTVVRTRCRARPRASVLLRRPRTRGHPGPLVEVQLSYDLHRLDRRPPVRHEKAPQARR